MLQVLSDGQRGTTDAGWLHSHHTFSFGEFYNPRQMGFRTLRVINEDTVAPGEGFGTHPHRDMEIVSYVVAGALQHKDSMGTGSVIRPGDVQRMSAGTGVLHSEFNGSDTEAVHFLQIWVIPERQGITPSYEQKRFSDEDKRDRLRLVLSRDGRDGSLTVHQDVALYASLLGAGKQVTHAFAPGRYGWVQLVKGELEVNGTRLQAGDGLALAEEPSVTVTAREDAEFLLFDLA